MPLPSVLNGAIQCQVLTKRTKQRCKNPCAFGSNKACRMHGSHKSRNVLRGADHPQYKNGERTKAIEMEVRERSAILRYLIDIGNHVDLFYKKLKARGRPPIGYVKLNLNEPHQLMLAILATIKKPPEGG